VARVPSFHKCHRFWRKGLPCAYRGVPHLDGDDGDKAGPKPAPLNPAAEPQIGLEAPTRTKQDWAPGIDVDSARKVYWNQSKTVWSRTHDVLKDDTVKPKSKAPPSNMEVSRTWPSATISKPAPVVTTSDSSTGKSSRSTGSSSLTPSVPVVTPTALPSPFSGQAYIDGMGLLETLYVEQLSRTVQNSEPVATRTSSEETDNLVMSTTFNDAYTQFEQEAVANDISWSTILTTIAVAVAASVTKAAINKALMAKVTPIRPGVVPGAAGGGLQTKAPGSAGRGGFNDLSIVDKISKKVVNQKVTPVRSQFRKTNNRILQKAGQRSKRPRGGKGRSVSRSRA